ncbi:MAG: ABC transporter permease [Gemmatimonadales bacterium]|nr:ABC transporter permease [Gemmatimonadales bacterium]
MPLHEAIRLALGMVRAQKLKSFFSMIGVLIGVTFLIAVVSIVQGMNVYMEDRFVKKLMGANAFQLRRNPNFNMGGVDQETWLSWRRRPRISAADADYVIPRLRTDVTAARWSEDRAAIMVNGKTAKDISLQATEPAYFRIKNLDIAAGRVFSDQEVRAALPVAVIGDLVAEKMFPGVDPIGKAVTIGGIPYRVVGVAVKQGTVFGLPLDKFVIVPYTSPARRLVNPLGILDEVSFQVKDPTAFRDALAEVEALMRARRQLKPREDNDFHLQTAEGALGTWQKISTILMAALPGLVAISLVVGGIVIMNIMLMSVTERTREIGIRKALGARRRDILAQFLVESATLSVVGAAAGVGLGLGLAWVVKELSPLPAAVAPWSIAVGVLLGVFVGIVAGVYPANRAAKLDPITALRAE